MPFPEDFAVLVNIESLDECVEGDAEDGRDTVQGAVYRLDGADYLYYGNDDTCDGGHFQTDYTYHGPPLAYHLVYGSVWSSLQSFPGVSTYIYPDSCDQILELTVVGVVGDVYNPPHSGFTVPNLYVISATMEKD